MLFISDMKIHVLYFLKFLGWIQVKLFFGMIWYGLENP